MDYIREEFEEQMFDKILNHRFKDAKDLQNAIDNIQYWVDSEDVLSHVNFELEDMSEYYDYLADYNLAGTFITDDFYCDLDIYYLIDRHGSLFVTEIGYDYE